MSGWITDMADAVDAYEAAQAPPRSKASMPAVYQDEVPTEPATSPRSQIHEVPVLPTYVEELRLPSREYGPHPEPERFATRYILNDGTMTQEAYDELTRKASQSFNNRDMEKERRQAEAAEYEAHLRSIQEWEAKVKARELDNAALPCGPTPDGTSSMRALPDVHAALRQNDPKMASFSQPVVKKAPPSSGRPMPSVFRSDAEPPRIGAPPVQPPPPAAPRPVDASSANLPLAATPMTPSHPPRPPKEALPKHPSMETSSCASKHPLEPPTAQAPPSKHVRCKAFPHPSQPPDQVFMAASAAVEMPQSSRPCPKGPPAEFMPTPPEVESMQPNVYTYDQRSRMNDQGKYLKVKSVLDIDWSRPLWEQLAPVLKGGPDPTKSQADLRTLRARVPELTNQLFEGIFPADNVITAVQKSHGVHKIHMREAAAWVLNGTHWFSILQQPMMVIVWCHDWEDASKFQYLMQILQAHYGDFVPRYQIFMYDDSKVYGPVAQWQEPTTVWDGTPVIGFMAETFSMIYPQLASRTSIQCGHSLRHP